MSLPHIPPAESKLVSVSQQDLVLIVPKGHPLAGAHVIDLADTLSKQKNNPCRSTRVVLLERVTRLELATSTLARWLYRMSYTRRLNCGNYYIVWQAICQAIFR